MRCTKTNRNYTKTTYLRFYPPVAANEAESGTHLDQFEVKCVSYLIFCGPVGKCCVIFWGESRDSSEETKGGEQERDPGNDGEH